MRRRLSFGAFRLDPVERRLWKGLEPVALAPKPLTLLLYLAGRPGRLVTKEELLQAVWSDVHVGDAVLKTCVAEIRQALGDEAVSPRLIETVPRQGYRFVAPIQCDNVPTRTTRFIGRTREIQDVKSFLDNSHVVTLLGAPGVGKSSLAVRVASDLLHELPHGACWVDLSSLFEGDRIASSVGAALGLSDCIDRSAVEALIDFLEHRELLLVLDNSEHLVDACGEFIHELCQHCDHLKILATGREPLCVDREIAWRVPVLSLPDPSDPLDRVLESEAAQLFLDRAQIASPGFQLTARNSQAIADICRRLDGLPLSIELAAARTAILTPEEIATRLDDALSLLDGDGRMPRTRRQTLGKALEWSYETLSAKERLALAILTVFAGDFSLCAAEEVCVGTQEFQATEVVTMVSRLVDKSMIVVVSQPELPGTRFKMLQIVRQFARKKIPEHLSSALTSQHAEYFVRWTARIAPMLRGANREEYLSQVEREYTNLCAVLEWSRSAPIGLRSGTRIAGAIWPYWLHRGHIHEGLNWLELLLVKDENAPAQFRAPALTGAGALAQSAGNYKIALAYFTESVGLCRATNNPVELGIALYQFARIAYREGEVTESALALEESIQMLTRCSCGWYLGLALSEKGTRAMCDGRLDESTVLLEEAASIMRYNGDLVGVTVPLKYLALLATVQQQYGRALSYCREALSILRPINEHWMISFILEVVATVKCSSGRSSEAIQLLGAADRLRGRDGRASDRTRDHETMLKTLRASLSGEEFDRLWEVGRAMSHEEAIATATDWDYALTENVDRAR